MLVLGLDICTGPKFSAEIFELKVFRESRVLEIILVNKYNFIL